ncbi:MAG: hypothetical protein DCC67_19890, partial [Planctomycetota bacterium]
GVTFTAASPRHVAAASIVSPPGAEAAEGASSVTPARLPLRIQYLIPAAELAGLPAGQRRLVAFNFRGDATQTTSVNWTQPQEQIWISTTPATTLSDVFDANHGPNKVKVFDGTITYPILGTGPAAGPRPFAPGPRLQTPFDYDPSMGNLLIELRDFDKNYPEPATIDVVTMPSSSFRTMLAFDANATSGTLVPDVVTPIRLEFVPEPSAWALACLALAGVRRLRQATEARS